MYIFLRSKTAWDCYVENIMRNIWDKVDASMKQSWELQVSWTMKKQPMKTNLNLQFMWTIETIDESDISNNSICQLLRFKKVFSSCLWVFMLFPLNSFIQLNFWELFSHFTPVLFCFLDMLLVFISVNVFFHSYCWVISTLHSSSGLWSNNAFSEIRHRHYCPHDFRKLVRPTAAAIMLKILMQQYEEITDPLKIFHAFAMTKYAIHSMKAKMSFPHLCHYESAGRTVFFSLLMHFLLKWLLNNTLQNMSGYTTEKNMHTYKINSSHFSIRKPWFSTYYFLNTCKIDELKAKAKNSNSDVMGFESAAFNFAHENARSLTARMC